MLEKIAIFILFLGPLVFFHELGHFLFARLFGVKVEVFSIGFGPKLLKFKRGDTEYAVSLIPLGGYVKMFGDDPFKKDEIPENERKQSFTHKGKWARFWIVFGGPLANFLLAYCLFFSLFLAGERLPEIKIGSLPTDSKVYTLGVRPGDVLQRVNGKEVTSPSDIALEASGDINSITVTRLGESKKLEIGLKGEEFVKEFMSYPPYSLRRPFVVDKSGNIFGISLSNELNLDLSIEELILTEPEKVYLLEVVKDADLAGKVVKTTGKARELSVTGELLPLLREEGFNTVDLQVRSISAKSPAEASGIRADDVILGLDGKEIYSFEVLRNTLQKIKGDTVAIRVLKKDGILREYNLKPDIKVIEDKEYKLIGVYSGGIFNGVKFVDTPSKGFVNSLILSFPKTFETMGKTLQGFGKLLTGEISLKNVGGPLMIGKVASDSFNTSISYFLQLMALFSVHLGIINLFPIPVLDGGHIMFIGLELINRGPLSRKTMEIAQQFGVSILLMLMVGAIFNDFSRFF